MKTKFTALLLAMLFLLTSASFVSCDTTSPEESKSSEKESQTSLPTEKESESETSTQPGEYDQESLELIVAGESKFKIIVSQTIDYAADKASYIIKEAVEAVSGVKLPISKDHEEFLNSLTPSVKAKYNLQREHEEMGGTTNMFADCAAIEASYDRSAPFEIVIGETDRPESIRAMAELTDEDQFIVRVDGNKLVLVASSTEAMVSGAEYLVSECLGYSHEDENVQVTDLTVEDPNKSMIVSIEDGEQMSESFAFEGRVSKEVLCNYLSRAVTVSGASISNDYVKDFILNTGAKYICRFATCWAPSIADYNTYETQREVIASIHEIDPDVVFEACVFEYVSRAVNDIPIPAWVFEAFGMEPEERNFSYDNICFTEGGNKDIWGVGASAPDITRQETMLFLYYRACAYIDLGYEALHMGQVHMIGANDTGWKNWTILVEKIREFAKENARRHFVFLNAHTDGILDSNGVLLFDFHMYPSRPVDDMSQEEHFPTEDNPQRAYLEPGHIDAIYGKSRGGMTYSGWKCDSLPYLVELDNGGGSNTMAPPDDSDIWVWGMDEITWFANQPASYRAEFLEYAYNWLINEAGGDGFFAMPGHRTAKIFDENYNVVQSWYMAFDPANCPGGNGDEMVIKRIWESYPIE